VHLAERSEPGSRYFLANSDPIQVHEFAETFARVASRSLKVQRLPRGLARMLLGPLVADRLEGDRVFSNIRLRGTGFRKYGVKTLEEISARSAWPGR
jgi:NAD dependent epimerase/dehydratase family enzyme